MPVSRIFGVSHGVAAALAVAATALAVTVLPASAQKMAPEIAEKERRDPASGEVIILNSRKSDSVAPDPYAPIKRQALPDAETQNKAASDAKPPTAPEPPAARLEPRKEASIAPVPPPPTLAPPQTGAVSTDDDAQRPDAERRPTRRLARRDDDQLGYQRPRPDVRYRRPFGERPWRWCRELAWRCEDGFERACNRWQRNCS